MLGLLSTWKTTLFSDSSETSLSEQVLLELKLKNESKPLSLNAPSSLELKELRVIVSAEFAAAVAEAGLGVFFIQFWSNRDMLSALEAYVGG